MDNETSTAITSREFYPYWINESVRFADLDPLGHVNNAAISTYFEGAGGAVPRRWQFSRLRPLVCRDCPDRHRFPVRDALPRRPACRAEGNPIRPLLPDP